jgi:hypothetical protein
MIYIELYEQQILSEKLGNTWIKFPDVDLVKSRPTLDEIGDDYSDFDLGDIGEEKVSEFNYEEYIDDLYNIIRTSAEQQQIKTALTYLQSHQEKDIKNSIKLALVNDSSRITNTGKKYGNYIDAINNLNTDKVFQVSITRDGEINFK